MSRSSALAEAVKDVINANEYSVEFTATRGYRVFYNIKEVKDLKVTVIAPIVEEQIVSRSGNFSDVTIDIILKKQVDPSSNDDMDALCDLTEEITDSLRGTRQKKWIWLESKITVPYDIEDLSSRNIFTSVISLKYRVGWVK